MGVIGAARNPKSGGVSQFEIQEQRTNITRALLRTRSVQGNQYRHGEPRMMLICYPSKKALKEEIGKPLRYRETSIFGEEFKPDGTFAAAYRPSIWRHEVGGREFFAQITMQGGLISKVS